MYDSSTDICIIIEDRPLYVSRLFDHTLFICLKAFGHSFNVRCTDGATWACSISNHQQSPNWCSRQSWLDSKRSDNFPSNLKNCVELSFVKSSCNVPVTFLIKLKEFWVCWKCYLKNRKICWNICWKFLFDREIIMEIPALISDSCSCCWSIVF